MGYLDNNGVTKLTSYLCEKIRALINRKRNVFFGTCKTAVGTAAKVVDCPEFKTENLVAGAVINVYCVTANTYNGMATLNVNSTGARNIKRGGGSVTRYYWSYGETVTFVFDGDAWQMAEKGTATTTYYGVTKLSSATNSTSTELAATPSAVKAAYDLANGKQDALVSGTNIKTVNGNSLLGSGDIATPTSKIYSGTADPDNSVGVDGDVYIKYTT